jgi:hypothetical protein
LNEQYSTGQSDPYGTHQRRRKIGDERRAQKGPTHIISLRLLTKVSTADSGFLMWLGKKEATMDIKVAKKEYLLGAISREWKCTTNRWQNRMTILTR